MAVLISIQPKWCELIASGRKTIEVRKTAPKVQTPFKCYIYCTQHKYNHLYDLREVSNGDLMLSVVQHNKTSLVADGYLNGKVIGEFVCDRVDEQIVFHKGTTRIMIQDYKENLFVLCKAAALSLDELHDYIDKDIKDFKIVYGWHISEFKIYDTPKELEDFRTTTFGEKDSCNTCENYPTKENGIDYYSARCKNCKKSHELFIKKLTRPPQSWCYAELWGEV